MSALRNELHQRLDHLPEEELEAIAPLLRLLYDRYNDFIIETNLTEDEKKIIEQGRAEYKTNPEKFVSLDEFL